MRKTMLHVSRISSNAKHVPICLLLRFSFPFFFPGRVIVIWRSSPATNEKCISCAAGIISRNLKLRHCRSLEGSVTVVTDHVYRRETFRFGSRVRCRRCRRCVYPTLQSYATHNGGWMSRDYRRRTRREAGGGGLRPQCGRDGSRGKKMRGRLRDR